MIATMESAYTVPPGVIRNTVGLFLATLRAGGVRPWRSIATFAEEEIIVPTGPFAGRKFRLDRQPYARHLYHEIDKDCWEEIACVGPSQSGKTLVCFTIPILYLLFEKCEDTIVMAPSDDVCIEKWERDIKPVIERTQYDRFLPRTGKGARGGFDSFMQFGNGKFLKWMTAGGNDKRRAHYTAKNIVMTEVDGMATVDTTSLESDKVKQVEARGNAYADKKRVLKECTVTIPTGHIWTRYKHGTESALMLKCPHCSEYVSLCRHDFRGWQDAETEVQAKQLASFFCSKCGEKWSEDNRRKANEDALLVHSGQKIENGKVVGEPKETLTLGFRWSAVNNLLETMGNLGVQEWNGSQDHNKENAEKKLMQFNWALPYDDPNFTMTRLDPRDLARRQGAWVRGYVPEECDTLTMGVDVQKRSLYWTMLAMLPDGRRHVVDYGIHDVEWDTIGNVEAIRLALVEFRERVEQGWSRMDGKQIIPAEVWIDAGYWSNTIYGFINDPQTNKQRYRPTLGRGFGQQKTHWYNQPKSTGNVVKYIGNNFHVTYFKSQQCNVIELNTDYWKTILHSMLLVQQDSSRHLTLFQASKGEHTDFCAHLAAEHQEEKFYPERGRVVVWRAHSKNNHWLDSTSLALVASCAIEEYRSREQKQSVSAKANAGDATGSQPTINLRRGLPTLHN